jgi:DNA repair exonuclease SbcCD ATPase subunit
MVDSIRNHALFNQFTKLMAENEILAKQNRLFQSYLARYEQTATTEDVPDVKHQRRGNKPQPKKLSLEQLMQIAGEEHDYRHKQLLDLEERVKSDISLLKAITEATRIRINEMRKEAYEFKRDIVLGGTNARTGRIMAEKVVRYFDEKLKAKTALLMKIRAKNQALRQQRMKMDTMVKQKKEQGESLHSIDFHQLEIKNQQFNAKKQERDEDLRKLKRTTGKTVQTLNNAKRQLNDLLGESKRLQTSIRERKKATERLSAELKRVETEVAKEKERNKKFNRQMSNPDMPQVTCMHAYF